MPDAPDLSKLPCPEGCRWESGRGIGILDLKFFRVRLATIRKDGQMYKWHVVGDSFPAYAMSYEEAALGICDWIGLSPAPAPARTFTEAEVKVLMEDCLFAGSIIRGQMAYLFSGQLTGGTCEPSETPKEVADAIHSRQNNIGAGSAREFHQLAYIQYVFQEYITAALAAAKNKEK